YNERSFGIEICVNEGGNFKQAVDNAAELTRQLMREYNVPASKVIQHNAASGKDCPRYLRNGSKGVNWADFKRLISGNTNVKPTPKKPAKPAKSMNKAKPKAEARLAIDGKWGRDTTRALQRSLGTPVDGIISRQLRNSVTEALYGGTVRYGSGGSLMVRALQHKVGAKVDGYLGPNTVRRLQRYLG